MAKTVVGIFANFGKAESVKEALVDAGFQPESIKVMANEEGGSAFSTTSSSSIQSAGKTIGEKISSFFHSFSGSDDQEHAYYAKRVTEGGALVAVTVEDHEADDVAELLEEHGASRVDEDNAAVGTKGLTSKHIADTNEVTAIPIVEEQLVVGKREVDRGGVRVYSHVTERPVEAEVALREEHVVVARRPVNRPATAADFGNVNGEVIELTEKAEEAVVGKSSRVVEEVLVGKESTERTEAIRDSVRRTEVDVEQIPSTETTVNYNR